MTLCISDNPLACKACGCEQMTVIPYKAVGKGHKTVAYRGICAECGGWIPIWSKKGAGL